MPTYPEAKGRGVSSLGEGKMIGTVDDLLIDPAALRVRWLRVGSGKLLGGGHWLPAEAVREIDGQAMTIDSEADERDFEGTAASAEPLSSVREIIGRPVVDASGNESGRVRDFGFALEGFAIETQQVIQEVNDAVVNASSLDLRARSMRLDNGVIILTDRRARRLLICGGTFLPILQKLQADIMMGLLWREQFSSASPLPGPLTFS